MRLSIFDRWGELVFETTNISNGWDGTFSGKKLDGAVFAYNLKINSPGGKTISKTGNVTLLR
jgi:gliding motility-associated-like protein